MSTYIPFLRVSTSQQETARQLADIQKFAKQQHWPLGEPVQEVVSGAKQNKDRAGILKLLQQVKRGDTVVATEVTRLGRDTQQMLTLIKELTERGVSVYTMDFHIASLNPDGKPNPIAELMFAFGAVAAKMERNSTISRVQSGIAEAKRKGVVFGRKEGSSKTRKQFLRDHADVVRHLEDGRSVRKAAFLTEKSTATVRKVKKMLDERETAENEETADLVTN